MVSVIIATYLRDEYLLSTLGDLSQQKSVDYEIICVDQTTRHAPAVEDMLNQYAAKGNFTWLKQSLPSPNKARNLGASAAKGEILVFIDDDVYIKDEYFLQKHLDNYMSDKELWAVSGGEILEGELQPERCSTCNFSIRRNLFIALGGLDENFKGTGYSDDLDLGLRVIKSGGKIIYDPKPQLIHRRAAKGGCRIGGGAKYPGWHRYVSPFIFGFRHLKGKELRSFIVKDALRKSLFLKYNVLRPILWPKVFLDTVLAVCHGRILSKKPVTSIFTNIQPCLAGRQAPRFLYQPRRLGIKFFDYRAYILMFREIFVEGDYFFSAGNNKPRIIDCGGNIGMSVLFFKKLYPKSEITVFEPDKKSFRMMNENITANRLENVTVINKALYGSRGSIPFYCDRLHPGSPEMSVYKKAFLKDTQVVEAVTLSDYIKEEVDFLKIDIEGAEMPVIEELSRSGKMRLVKEMIVECHYDSEKNKDAPLGMMNILEKEGFACVFKIPLSASRFGKKVVLIHGSRKR